MPKMVMSPGPSLMLACFLTLAGPRSGLAISMPVQSPSMAALLDSAKAGFSAEGAAEFRKGVSLRSSDPPSAAKSFGRAATLLPGMADWALVLQAESLAKSGDTTAVEALLACVEPGLAVSRGWRARVAAYRSAGSMSGAARAAESALERATDVTTRAAIAAQLGAIRLTRADTAGAMAAFRVALDAAPGSASALEAGRTLASLRATAPEDQLVVGRLFFRHGNAVRGIAGYQNWLNSGRGTAPERAAIRLELARNLFAARLYTDAETRLRELVTDRAAPAVAAESRVLLGKVELRRGRIEDGIRTLNVAIEEPATPRPAMAEALFALADAEDDRGAGERAGQLYRRLLADYASSMEAADAAMRLGGMEYAAGRYTVAAGIFDAFRDAHKSGPRAQQAAWWAAQAWRMAGDTAASAERFAEAQQADPVSYYGLRAGETIGRPITAFLTASPSTDAATTARAAGSVVRLNLLASARLDDEVGTELSRARRFLDERTGGLYALAEAMHADGGRSLDAVRLGRDIQRAENAWNDRLLRVIWPLPYRSEIFAAAVSRGLDPWIVAGLIRQESLFRADARSSAGAVGLMQILPPTGRDLAKRDGMRNFAPSMLNDPAVNIRLGTLFVSDLLRRHDGSVSRALAAYNAGPSRVTRWLRLPSNNDPDVFAERIPFPETRDYVRIVQQNARIYAALYGIADDGNRPDTPRQPTR